MHLCSRTLYTGRGQALYLLGKRSDEQPELLATPLAGWVTVPPI